MPHDPLALVAPELAPALELMTDFSFDDGVEAFRAPFQSRVMPPLPPELAAVAMEERLVPGAAGAPDVRVLHYMPPEATSEARPALLYIHGGGYVLGNADMVDPICRAIAAGLRITVVSVDYRLAPETLWPGALEDCYAALNWMHDSADALGIDPARIAVAGDSAGGGHAVALALHARDIVRRHGTGPTLCFQMLDAPMLDDRTGTSADPHPHTGHFVWTPEKNRFGWRSLLGVEPGSPDVPQSAVPARAADLSDLPPAFVTVGSIDLFLEEDMEYVRRLTRAGVPAELHVIPGAYHGFAIAQNAPQVLQARELRHKALARALGLAQS